MTSFVIIVSGIFVVASGYDKGDTLLMLAGVFTIVIGSVIKLLFED